jgi:hypothetical protein
MKEDSKFLKDPSGMQSFLKELNAINDSASALSFQTAREIAAAKKSSLNASL